MTMPGRLTAALAALTILAPVSLATAEGMTKEILAAQLRKQGHICTNPLAAERDREHSKPLEAVWFLRCGNGNFRVRLVPKMAAKVEPVE